jgi:hypothetical protein
VHLFQETLQVATVILCFFGSSPIDYFMQISMFDTPLRYIEGQIKKTHFFLNQLILPIKKKILKARSNSGSLW